MAAIIGIEEGPSSPETNYSLDGDRRFIRRILVRTDEILMDGSQLLDLIPQFGAAWTEFKLGGVYKFSNNPSEYATCNRIVGPRRNLERRTEWLVSYHYLSTAHTDNSGHWYWDPPGEQPDDGGWTDDSGSWATQRPGVSAGFVMFSRIAFESQWIKPYKVSDGPPPEWEFEIRDWGEFTNSARQVGFKDPPPERDDTRLFLILERNVDVFDMGEAYEIVNTVNLKEITLLKWRGLELTVKPFEAKIKDIIPLVQFRGGVWHTRVRYEIDIRKNLREFAGSEPLRFTWVEQYYDKGWLAWNIIDQDNKENIGEWSPSDAKKGILPGAVPRDLEGNMTNYQVLFDGNGVPLELPILTTPLPDPPGGEATWPDTSKAVKLNYLHYPALDWSNTVEYQALRGLFPSKNAADDLIENSGPTNWSYANNGPAQP